jgi:integrase
VFSHAGKRVWRSTGTSVLEEAEQVFAELSTDYVSHKKLTIMQFREYLINLFEGDYAPGTLDIYARALKSLANTIGDRPIKSVNVLQVDTFKSRRRKEVSDTTVNIEFRTLKAAFNHALKYNFIDDNPFLRTNNIILAEKDAAFLTKKQFQQLLDVVDDNQMRSIILLAVMTGMRLGEIVGLQWANLNREEGIIRFSNRSGVMTKNRRPRTVYLMPRALTLFNEIPQTSEFVFPKGNGTKRCGRSVSRLFKKLVRKACLPNEIHFHSLRHTAATWLGQLHIPAPDLKKLMGHSSVSTTMRYLHVDAPHLRETLQVVNAFLEN